MPLACQKGKESPSQRGTAPPTATTPPGEVHVPTPDGGPAVPLPAWVGFPSDAAPLQQAIDTRDEAPLRAHAWRLWAGLNQPSAADDPRPVWWNWPTTSQIMADVTPGPPLGTAMTGHRHAARTTPPGANVDQNHAGECYGPDGRGVITLPSPTYVLPEAIVSAAGLPAECSQAKYAADPSHGCSLPDGVHFQNNGDMLIATESYTQPGADRIVARGYNSEATLDKLHKDGTKILEDFDRAQLTTKHMYWPVKAKGVSALPVYREPPRGDWCRYNGYETWDALVAIDPEGAAGPTAQVKFMFGVYDHAGDKPLPTKEVTVPVHGLDEFYMQRLDEDAWGALNEKDRWLIDAASRWAHGQPFEPGDYLVSIASHLMSAELPQWTLQSAWWSGEPDKGPYAQGRPALPDAVGPWAHYLLTIEYGIPTEPGGAELPVAYNPYIELAATHPVATNCRNCHLRAGWPNGSYLVSPGPGPLANIGAGDGIFAGVLLTNFQWVLADRVPRPKG